MLKKCHPVGVGMTPSKTELGNFMRTRRLEIGLRQVEVAKLSGICQDGYSKLEIGKRRSLSPKNLKKLAEALQCEPLQIQSLIPKKPEPKTELGRLIRARRERLKLTQMAFSEKTGIGISVIGPLERDKTRGLSHHQIKLLAKALDLEPSALMNYVYVGKAGRKTKATGSKLGQLIRTRRNELELSQSQLAQKLQISRQFMSQIELGLCPLNKNGSSVMVEQLAQALKLDLAKLQAAVAPRAWKAN